MLGERIVNAIPEALMRDWTGAASTRITATIGLALFPREASNGGDLVRLADRRLYAGKTAGRNRVVTHDAA